MRGAEVNGGPEGRGPELVVVGHVGTSIVHKISIVRLVNLDTTPARLHEWLQKHPSTQNLRRYDDDDLPRLARRLESEATNELDLFLASVYRLGYHKLLISPFRPSVHRSPRASTPT